MPTSVEKRKCTPSYTRAADTSLTKSSMRVQRRVAPLARGAGGAELGHRAAAQLGLQHGADGAGQDAVRARVLRVHRRVDQRRPAGIGLGGVVAVELAVADGGDRAPEVVGVLGIEHGDQRFVHRLRRGGVEARVAQHVAPGLQRHRAQHAVVDGRQRVVPEARDLGLLRRAARAGLAAQRLDLVEVARPGGAGQRRRRGRAELRRAVASPRACAAASAARPAARSARRRRARCAACTSPARRRRRPGVPRARPGPPLRRPRCRPSWPGRRQMAASAPV